MRGEKPKTADEIIMCSALYDEWAIQDGKFTKANQDTSYSLAEYPQAWDVEE